MRAIPHVFLAVTLQAFAADSLPVRALAVFNRSCVQCHGEKVSMSGLRLLSRDEVLKGGTRGPAVKPGKADDSLLYSALSHSTKLAMPPAGKLAAEEIETLREWIDKGAEWPSVPASKTGAGEWWAFHKPVRPAVPGGAARSPIDAFINAKLRDANLPPSPEADRLTLLRRANFDLHGLPPSAGQIQAFLNDTQPGAWDRAIDALLASPRYGEKWGRHWLDLVRYGDTSGFEQDPYTLEAFRFRDYVIKAFNDDRPYDKFIKEQLAGDELWPDDPEARTGTGYFRVGTNRDMLFKVEELNVVEKLTDYVDTTSTVFLGLTTGCARCHDHKFDPIPQRDFYRMQAIFAPAVNDRVFLDYNPSRFYDIAANGREFKLRQIGEHIQRILTPYRTRLREEKIGRQPKDVQDAIRLKPEQRKPDQELLASRAETGIKVSDDDVRAALSQADAEVLHSIEKRLVSLFEGHAPPPMAPGLIDLGREAPRTHIALRGNWENPGEEVGPGFLTALGGGEIPEPPRFAKTTYRRKALAGWIANANNPLTARVMMNRAWQYHFGQGLVRTPSDFGTRAGLPSHPELLDWLATELVERKWSIKAMHRLIMTSDAYRRVSKRSETARSRDPENLLLSHMNRRRLQGDEIRDSVLQVSGTLNLKMGGMPVVPPLEAEELFGIIGKPESAWVVTANAEEHTRRSIYLLTRRTFKQPLFEAFDEPDGVASCARRNESTTAPQSLALLNGPFLMKQSRVLGPKIKSVDDAWLRILGRKPSEAERDAAGPLATRKAWDEMARGLMNTNEFLYVD